MAEAEHYRLDAFISSHVTHDDLYIADGLCLACLVEILEDGDLQVYIVCDEIRTEKSPCILGSNVQFI